MMHALTDTALGPEDRLDLRRTWQWLSWIRGKDCLVGCYVCSSGCFGLEHEERGSAGSCFSLNILCAVSLPLGLEAMAASWALICVNVPV